MMKKRICSLFLSAILLTLALCQPVAALYQGKDYQYDDYGTSIAAPAAMSVDRILDGEALGVGSLSEPDDLYVAPNQNIYLCDTGNDRVLVFDRNFKLLREITEVQIDGQTEILRKPSGTFVDTEGKLYICDTGNQRVLKLDGERVVYQYTMPKTELINQDDEYKPEKVVVDTTGCVYVVAYGIYQGLVAYENDGTFTSFFGSNKVELTASVLFEYTWKKLFTKEQREAMQRIIPVEYANVFIDSKNFIYTATSNSETSLHEVKKLNALGDNVLINTSYNTLYDKNDFGDLESNYEKGKEIDSSIVDVHVDANGIITLLDQTRGRLFQYDKDCNLLFTFGTSGNQSSSFRMPSSVEKLGEQYLVLDSTKGTITVLSYTSYAEQVKEAVMLYNDGKYIESVSLWEDVLKENSNLSLAYKGIGKARLQQGKYEEAMEYLGKSNDRQSYSTALREYRKDFIRQNIIWLILGGIAVVVGFIWLIRFLKIKLGFAVKKMNRHYR